MKQPNKTKALLLIALLAAALTVGGVCVAAEGDTDAAAPQVPPPPPAEAVNPAGPPPPPPEAVNPAGPPPPPPAMHPHGPKKHGPGLSPEMRQKVDTFMAETKPLRRQLFVAETALHAQVRANQPDNALIQELAGRIFDLKDELKTKARESGIPPMLIKALTGRPDLGPHGHGRGCRKGHKGQHPGMMGQPGCGHHPRR